MARKTTEAPSPSIRERIRVFINRPASLASVQPFFMPAKLMIDADTKDPLIEMIEERRAAAAQ